MLPHSVPGSALLLVPCFMPAALDPSGPRSLHPMAKAADRLVKHYHQNGNISASLSCGLPNGSGLLPHEHLCLTLTLPIVPGFLGDIQTAALLSCVFSMPPKGAGEEGRG